MKSALEASKGHEVKRLLFFLAVILFILTVLPGMPRLAIPLAIAYVWTLILSPLVPLFRKFGLSKLGAIVLIFVGLSFFMVYPVVRIAPMVQKEVDNIQYYAPKIEGYLRDVFMKVRANVQERTSY